MTQKQVLQSAGCGLACGAGLLAGGYAAYAGKTWLGYGRVDPGIGDDHDSLLDRFMPAYEVADRHHVHVEAPADTTFAAACDLDLEQSPVVRALFKTRELILGGHPNGGERLHRLLDFVKRLGWSVLAEIRGPELREIVVGAVTQPWKGDVVLRAIPPDAFLAFNEPDYVKIAWTIRVDAIGAGASIARVETRAVATDLSARAKFRRYWAVFSPGIVLIRHAALGQVKADAERRAREGTGNRADRFQLVSTTDLDAVC